MSAADTALITAVSSSSAHAWNDTGTLLKASDVSSNQGTLSTINNSCTMKKYRN
jgi:hypothetical protein